MIEIPSIPEVVHAHGAGRGPMALAPVETAWALDRIIGATEEVGDCYEFTGYRKNGYGSISIRNSDVYVHALALAIKLGGLIPKGQEACHTCDNRPCWNPAHLFAGTRLMNIMDARAKGRAKNPTPVRGERQHLATLTDIEVAEIRASSGPQRLIAAAFGCSQSTVWRIRHGLVRT